MNNKNRENFFNNDANAMMKNTIQHQTAELLLSLQKDLKLLTNQLKGNNSNPRRKPNKKLLITLHLRMSVLRVNKSDEKAHRKITLALYH